MDPIEWISTAYRKQKMNLFYGICKTFENWNNLYMKER